jgi:hypothetical protein
LKDVPVTNVAAMPRGGHPTFDIGIDRWGDGTGMRSMVLFVIILHLYTHTYVVVVMLVVVVVMPVVIVITSMWNPQSIHTPDRW